jgi:serine/threonine protein kinase
MSEWASKDDYDLAIAAKALRGTAIKDFTLKTYSEAEAKAKNAIILKNKPWCDCGNFAVVYQLTDNAGHSFVFRVFMSSGSNVSDLRTRYLKVANLTRQNSTDWLVRVEWLPEGLNVRGQWKPAVKMERVDGIDLDKWLQANKGDKGKVASVADQIRRLAKEFEEKKIAHGDLSHRNIMVTYSGHVRLVDYDAMYLPSLQSVNPNEIGLPGMQHPLRRVGSYGPSMDRFSILVLYATLLYLKEAPNALPKQCDDGLILEKKHFLDPSGSPLETMLRSADPALRKVANAIIKGSRNPIDKMLTLEDALAGPSVAPRSITSTTAPQSPIPSYLVQGSAHTGVVSGTKQAAPISSAVTGLQATGAHTKAVAAEQAFLDGLKLYQQASSWTAYRSAEKLLMAAVKLDNNVAKYHYYVALCNMRRDYHYPETAVLSLERAVALEPGNEEYVQKLSEAEEAVTAKTSSSATTKDSELTPGQWFLTSVIVIAVLNGLGWGGYVGYQRLANRTPSPTSTHQLWHATFDGESRHLNMELDLRDRYTDYCTVREVLPGAGAVLLIRSAAAYHFDHLKFYTEAGHLTACWISFNGNRFQNVRSNLDRYPDWVRNELQSEAISRILTVPHVFTLESIDSNRLKIADITNHDEFIYYSTQAQYSFFNKGKINYDVALHSFGS